VTAPLRLGQSEPVRAEGASVSGVHVLAGTALTVLWTGSLVDLLRRGPSWALVHLTVLGTLLLAGAVVLRSTGHGRRISLVLLAAGVASALAQGLGTYGETVCARRGGRPLARGVAVAPVRGAAAHAGPAALPRRAPARPALAPR
jgi:hypothetical protein